MKADVLTMVVFIFFIGVLLSGFGLSSVFESEPEPSPVGLQQGIISR